MHASRGTLHCNDATGEILFTRPSAYVHRSPVRRPASSVPDKHGQRDAGSRAITAVTQTYCDASAEEDGT